MNTLRGQDEAVGGDIIVCRDELADLAGVHFISEMGTEEAKAKAYKVLDSMDIDGCIASASERFWDSVIDEIDDAAFDALNG